MGAKLSNLSFELDALIEATFDDFLFYRILPESSVSGFYSAQLNSSLGS
jgi:hypothetical protein